MREGREGGQQAGREELWELRVGRQEDLREEREGQSGRGNVRGVSKVRIRKGKERGQGEEKQRREYKII